MNKHLLAHYRDHLICPYCDKTIGNLFDSQYSHRYKMGIHSQCFNRFERYNYPLILYATIRDHLRFGMRRSRITLIWSRLKLLGDPILKTPGLIERYWETVRCFIECQPLLIAVYKPNFYFVFILNSILAAFGIATLGTPKPGIALNTVICIAIGLLCGLLHINLINMLNEPEFNIPIECYEDEQ